MQQKLIIANWKKRAKLFDILALMNYYKTQRCSHAVDSNFEILNRGTDCRLIFCPGDHWWPYLTVLLSRVDSNLSSTDDQSGNRYFNQSWYRYSMNCKESKFLYWGWQDLRESQIKCINKNDKLNCLPKPQYVIIGHQDTRAEDDYVCIKHKIMCAKSLGIIPIICVMNVQDATKIIPGEVSNLYASVITASAVKLQKQSAINNQDIPLIIALEPPVSIGSDYLLPWPDLQQQFNAMRSLICDCGITNVKLLYGGNVNVNNIRDLSHYLVIDGVLVGRSSLPLSHFCQIIGLYNL